MKKIRPIRPRDASPGLGPLINSPAPTTKGASPIASNGKSETPSRIKNSNTPARATAIGEAIRAIVVKPRGFGVAAPNALTRATKKSGTLVAGQPERGEQTLLRTVRMRVCRSPPQYDSIDRGAPATPLAVACRISGRQDSGEPPHPFAATR